MLTRREDIPRGGGRSRRHYTGSVDLTDWYWLGVAAGLGVATGVAFNWILTRRATVVAGFALALAALAGVFVAFLVANWAAAVWAAGSWVGWLGLRRLSRAALPAAFLAIVVLAFVPALGYLEAVATPLVGERLRRRLGARYAGLRILAKD